MAKVKKAVGEGQKAGSKTADKAANKEGAAAPATPKAEAAPETKERKAFATVEVVNRPAQMASIFEGFRVGEVAAEVQRPRMMIESVEHGRGRGIVRNFVFRKFNEEARAVLFITTPRGLGGGSFEPTDRLLKPGEQFQVSFTLEVEGADRPIFFAGKGFFLRKSFYAAESPDNPNKPWVGPREEAAAKLPKNLYVAGDDVLEVRVDSITGYPHGPGSVRRDVLDRYLSVAKLYVIPSGAVWAQKSAQGNFFTSIRDPLDKFLEKEGVKTITPVTLDEFGNLGTVSLMVKEQLLSGIEHEIARPGVIKNPNDYLRDINAVIGFLLAFKMTDEVKEAVVRSFPAKAGKEEDVYLPLILERVTESREQYRVVFRLFPRDLVEERSRKSMDRGLKFVPPYALHPGAENHNTYSKLLIAINQRFHEDEKPEEEKLKSEKLLASVQQRISDQRHKFVDEKVKAAFQDRVAAAKRKEDGG